MIWIGSGPGWGWGSRSAFPARASVRDRPGVDSVAAGYSLSIDCARRLAAQWLGPAQSFIERWVNRLLYYDLPAWMFTLSYLVFALMVLLTWRRIPPRQRR